MEALFLEDQYRSSDGPEQSCEQGAGDSERSARECGHDLSGRAPECENPGLAMTGRVDAIGEKRPRYPALEIDPQAGAGKSRMPDGRVRTRVTAVPSWMAAFPTHAARRRFAMTYGGDGGRREQ